MAGLQRVIAGIRKQTLRNKVMKKLQDGWYLEPAGLRGMAGWCRTDGKKGFQVPVWLMNELFLGAIIEHDHECPANGYKLREKR